jgi:hypothetical protein
LPESAVKFNDMEFESCHVGENRFSVCVVTSEESGGKVTSVETYDSSGRQIFYFLEKYMCFKREEIYEISNPPMFFNI